MPAHIGERTQSPVLPADDDDRLLRHLVEEIVAGVGREALVARAEPVAEEQPLDVGLENLGIVVEGLSQRMIGRLPHAESGDAVVDGFGGNVDVHDQLVYHACSGGGRPAVARDRVLPNSGVLQFPRGSLPSPSGSVQSSALVLGTHRIAMSSNPATQRIVELLKGANLFRDFAPDDLAVFAESFRERQFEKGEMVFARGDAGTYLYVVAEGQVRIAVATS